MAEAAREDRHRRPLAPYLYSGFETAGMRRVNCTLKVQPHWTFGSDITILAPKRVTIPRDGQPHSNIRFHGCKIIQIGIKGGSVREEETVMPTTLTIGGPCNYTKGDKKDFEIMMRTKEQSLIMHLPPNGEFDWPDYKAFETCPLCCKRAKPGSDYRYWLLFQPLLQHYESQTQTGMGIRFINRLTCEDCFESLVDNEFVQAKVQGETRFYDVPLLDVVEKQGPITWMHDGQMNDSSHSGECMNAYALYGAWENSGAWQAMSDKFSAHFQELSGGFEVMKGKGEIEDPNTFWEMGDIPIKDGRKCDGPDCPHVHGNRKSSEPGKTKGKKVRLQECMGCFETMYCSEQCQRAAWADHKEFCKEVQRKRKEEDKKEKERQRLDDEARLEAALASFVPLSIIPQAGGSKKKKGKKGGGKKKSGKKK